MTGAVALGCVSAGTSAISGAGSEPDEATVTAKATVKAMAAAAAVDRSAVAGWRAKPAMSRRVSSSGIGPAADLRGIRTDPTAPADDHDGS
jgi:hypothetical protein